MLDAFVFIIVISFSRIDPLIISFGNVGLLVDGLGLQAVGLDTTEQLTLFTSLSSYKNLIFRIKKKFIILIKTVL